jgi:Holliday junction DNA helicase RuvA
VGPKLGLALLSVHPPGALRRCVADDDVDALCLVPGVGKRTAQKLMIELKSRLGVPDLDLVEPGGDGGPTPRAEVRAALAELGYGPDEMRVALADLPEDGTVGDLLRAALKRLAVRA